jgi:hypothetical protein
VKQRLKNINYDVVFDTALLEQMLSDNSNTLFPLFTSTERIDRITYNILMGQVAVLSNHAIVLLSCSILDISGTNGV